MTHILAFLYSRLSFVGLGILSFAPFTITRVLAQAHIYDIRLGGLHPVEILLLRWAGDLATCVPIVIASAFILSFIRPAMIHSLVIACVTLSLLAQLLFLYSAVFVIILYVAPPHI